MPTYTLREDTGQAFYDAVRNGQTLLALEYAIRRFDELEARIAELEGREPAPAVVTNNTAAPRKATKAKTDSVDGEEGVE